MSQATMTRPRMWGKGIVGDEDSTGNIRKAMPCWVAQEPQARRVLLLDLRRAPNLDSPELFHRELLAFLDHFAGPPGAA